MAEQLGAHIVRKGLITQAQLDEALKSQLIYGGSLGTNLVELGLMDLGTLGQALADAYHFPVATDAELEAVSAETLAHLKPELARTHQAFPLAVEGRRLRVAMVSPFDLKQVDTLAVATGMRIVPSIVSELRLFQYLEKRYGIPKPTRPARPGQPKPALAAPSPTMAPVGQGAPGPQRPSAPAQVPPGAVAQVMPASAQPAPVAPPRPAPVVGPAAGTSASAPPVPTPGL
ncbi:MAG TPA: hypothetical protein VF794_30595, partial [Archangium sp.]